MTMMINNLTILSEDIQQTLPLPVKTFYQTKKKEVNVQRPEIVICARQDTRT
jgi:hypothetical protein